MGIPGNFLPTASAVVPKRRALQPAFQFLSSTFLDVGQVMRIALIFALYPIFFLVRWRVYKGLEVVIGQGITNGYLSPTLITGWR
jgi:hypothetical protein